MQSRPLAPRHSPQHDTAILEELNLGYVRSVATSDVGWFDEYLSWSFLNSNPDGTLVNRADFLAQVARPVAVSNLRCEDVRVRLFGDTAIIHVRTLYDKPSGEPGSGRYTDVWSRENGRWVCVAAHV